MRDGVVQREKTSIEDEKGLATRQMKTNPTEQNRIRVFDKFGNEVFITKEKWRTRVLPGTMKSSWDSPEKLYLVIVDSFHHGFFPDVLAAAEHLARIDTDRARGTCTYAIALMKNGCLDEAEKVLTSFTRQYGEEGYVLTNMAKVYSARHDPQKAKDTLWHALELDPNQDNGLAWYAAIHRERSGKDIELEALRRVAALSGSWRAQLRLARAALESSDLAGALSYYREALSRVGDKVPSDMLVQISGDLGKHGHLVELIALTERRFVPELHGIIVGNNLIKAHFYLGHIEAARQILGQMSALKRPDFQECLSYWDTEIRKARGWRTH
jgi:tetratricopeptide (TPR) repeat protein